MKLIVFEHGDSSVGIPERYYEIDCPFERDEVEEWDLDLFKIVIERQYEEYCEMSIDTFYDFENQFKHTDEP